MLNNTGICTDCSEGTILICYNDNYGTVCDDFWDTFDAMVVCGQLGITTGGMSTALNKQNL